METKPKFTIPPDPVNLPDIITAEEIAAARARIDEKEKTPDWVKDLMEMENRKEAPEKQKQP